MPLVAMKPKKLHWWVVPGILTASLAGVGAMGTFIVRSADYIKLPEAVAAESKRNDTQDQRLDKLITLQEYQQQANQLAPSAPSATELPVWEGQGIREWDGVDECFYCCPWEDRKRCYDEMRWFRCR